MAIQIIGDSCCDWTPALKNLIGLRVVSLRLRPSPDQVFVDDDSLDTLELISAMKAARTATSTSCPAPEEYAEAMRDSDQSIIVTLSSKLSGSYNAAVVGRNMVLEEYPEKEIFVLDSESASAGETRLVLFLYDLIRAGVPFREIVQRSSEFRDRMHTLFVLEDLSNLIKNGRISKAAGVIGSILSLRPIMSDDGHGSIVCLDKIRGTANALARLTERIAVMTAQMPPHSVQLVLSQCNCLQRALDLKKTLLSSCPSLEDVLVVPTRGVSTVYAFDGGIVVAF